MVKKRLIREEHHQFGGSGTVYAARSEELCKRLEKELAESVQLIYLDPPFGTGNEFRFRNGSVIRAYSDTLDENEYLSMMKTILAACRTLLCASGSLYVHVDYRMSGRLRLMLDELLGAENFMNEIIWVYKSGGRATNHYSRKHDNILFYRRSKDVFFNIKAVGTPRGDAPRNHMKRRVDENGEVYYSIRARDREYRYYANDLVFPSDVWSDIEHLHQRDPERTGFSTQKPIALLKRIIMASSREGDTVLDFFGGSGTTAAAAAMLNRNFISCDCGDASLFATRRRLIESQRETEMFESEAPLNIVYEQPERYQTLERVDDLVEINAVAGGYEVVIRGNEDNQCVFASTGRADGNIYIAKNYSLRPREDEKLFVPKGGILHIVDSGCRQGFFELD